MFLGLHFLSNRQSDRQQRERRSLRWRNLPSRSLLRKMDKNRAGLGASDSVISARCDDELPKFGDKRETRAFFYETSVELLGFEESLNSRRLEMIASNNWESIEVFIKHPVRILTWVWLGLSLAGIIPLEAAVIRLDNRPGRPSDFPDLGTAISKAQSGDVIYVAGSPENYGAGKRLEINKPLTLIGPGYFLDENLPKNDGASHAATIESILIGTEAEGTRLVGLAIPVLWFHSDHVKVERCYLQEIIAGHDVPVLSPVITQNLFWTQRQWGMLLNAREAIIANNIFWGAPNTFFIAETPPWAPADRRAATATFSQNTIIGGKSEKFFPTTHFDFSNNIILLSSALAETAFRAAFAPDLDDNVIGHVNGDLNAPVLHDIFLMNGSRDARFQLGLLADNPARGAGQFGEELGAYGGATPYVLSGLPPLPFFDVFEAQSTVGPAGTLRVRVKAVGGE